MPTLDQASVDQFHREGYTVVEDLLDEERDIRPLVNEYTALLDKLATRWYAEGRLVSSYAYLSFGQRLIQVLREVGEGSIQNFEITLPFRKLGGDTPIHLGPAVFNLMRSPRILDAVESLIGSEIYCHPAHHSRIKLPVESLSEGISDLTGTVMCHQDQSGTLPEADQSNIVTAWLAITDATVDNGCLILSPGSHLAGLRPHIVKIRRGKHAGTAVSDDALKEENLIPLPVKRGSVIFFTARTIHGSLPNNTKDAIRWSIDLRYLPIGLPTGRPVYPGFVARSRKQSQSELRDHHVWVDMWLRARNVVAAGEPPEFFRYKDQAVMSTE